MNCSIGKKYKAFSLFEIILAIAIFSLTILLVGTLSIEGIRATKNMSDKNTSLFYLKEIFNAITITKNELWSQIVINTNSGPKHLNFINNRYSIFDDAEVINGVTFSFSVGEVQRDVSGNIVNSGGTVDPHSRVINVIANWTDLLGQPNNVSSGIYVNDWNTLDILQTLQTDFDLGTNNLTHTTNLAGGEVSLLPKFYPDWCKPTVALSTYDIPGAATSKTLFSYPGITYLGTDGGTGIALTKLIITSVEYPEVTVAGTFNGYTVNNIFVDGNYAYLATTNTNKDVVIINISTTPYTEVGYFNTSRSEEAESVYVVGTTGYVAAGKYIFTFNLTSKTGARAQYGLKKISLNENWGQISVVSQIVVKNNYLFASLDEDWYEMSIVNVTNPASMGTPVQTNVNNQQTLDIYVNDAGTRAYFGTNNSSYEREFFIVNTTDKTHECPIIGSYDTNGMNIKGIAIVARDSRAVLVGTGAEEYQSLNISNERSIVRCGGMQLNLGISDVDSVIDIDGNAFSYIVTNDALGDFKIMRGGPGLGGDINGYGYIPSGDYTSNVFDTDSTTTTYYYMEWLGLKPAGTDLKLQVRAGTTEDLSALPWIGPDGTVSSFYTAMLPTALPTSFKNKRYFQYKAFFTSDTISTSRLDQIKINYQK